MRQFAIKFQPQDKKVSVPQGTDLLTAATKAGIILTAPCGGEGLCGKCRLIVKKGTVKSEYSNLISDADRKKGMVLACQAIVESDLEVNVPKESVEAHAHASHEAEDFTKGIVLERESAFIFSPFVRKIFIELERPTTDDNSSDLERIEKHLRAKIGGLHLSTRLANLKHLSEVIRDSDFKITAVLSYKDGFFEMLSVEPGDTTASNYAFAFDIGTTTVVGQLIDMNTKSILGTRIAFNKQASYGSDVITRIIYASQHEDGLGRLNSAILDNINEIVEDLVASCRVSMADVYAVVCAGNMTMMHLLLKIDPSNIRKAPYVPTVNAFPPVSASELSLEINPKGVAAFIPGVSTYLGGDIVAGLLACGIAESEETCLLVDIGTNGEVVLGNKDWMIGAAASAGPAFEGSGLSCGMKAVQGAIQKVAIDEDFNVQTWTIGELSPKGICGSGYIDILCQMLKRGIITKDGKIDRLKLSKRIRKTDTGYEFVVVFKGESGAEKDIAVHEDDIENLKRSKGAIYSAIIALLNKVGKSIDEVKRIYIAGGFGNYLNIENSIYIGLLPDIARSVYEFVGNSSLAGARMALLSHEAYEMTMRIYKNITYLDLSAEPNYMDEYIASLFFPHTDLGRFPSVRL
ncbi:MAG: ASKHA domain-containing protein [Candidatus Omnitrophica bacterium]|nr:ASKHA domain-containing protein [Candidatus Omnitrophota bacterium]